MALSPEAVNSRSLPRPTASKGLDPFTGVAGAQPLAGTDGARVSVLVSGQPLCRLLSPAGLESSRKSMHRRTGPDDLRGSNGWAPTWGRDGTILFTQFVEGIYRVSGEGGTPARVTTVDKTRRELNHYWPEFLPDGRHFMYLATALDANGLRRRPASTWPRSIRRTRRCWPGCIRRVVYAPPGYVLFVEQGALLAQTFDAATLKLNGEPVRIAEGIAYYRTLGHAAFSVSTKGVLAFQGARMILGSSGTIDGETPPTRDGRNRTTARCGSRRMPEARRSMCSTHIPGHPTSGFTMCRRVHPSDSHSILTMKATRCGRRMAAASCSG